MTDQTPIVSTPTAVEAHKHDELLAEFNSRSPVHHLLTGLDNSIFNAACALGNIPYGTLSERELKVVRDIAYQSNRLMEECLKVIYGPDVSTWKLFDAYFEAFHPNPPN